MTSPDLHFSEQHVVEVAAQVRNATKRYDQLFVDLGSQIYADIVGMDNAVEIMAACRKWTDDALMFFTRHLPLTTRIDCQQGCCHCCSLPVVCPPQVIVDIAKYLKNTVPSEKLIALKEEMQRYVSGNDGSQLCIQCPFLSTRKLCQIYDYRPLTCRSFTSPDRQQCLASVTKRNNIVQDPVRHRVFQAATTALVGAAKQNGLPCQQVEFIPALLEILEIDWNVGYWRQYRIP